MSQIQLDFAAYSEVVEPLVNLSDLSAAMPPEILRRLNFPSKERVYFVKGVDHYFSGITGAISNSGLVDHSNLHKARLNKALNEGINVQEEWDERRDYGTLFHMIVNRHERIDDERQEFIFHSIDWENFAENYCKEYDYMKLLPMWKEWIRNDMAAYFQWKKDYNVKVLATEIGVWNCGFKIATPLDLIVEMDFNRKRVLSNVNLKTGTSAARIIDYEIQTAFEMYLYNEWILDSKYKLSNTHTWRPKDRSRSACNYELSSNYAKAYGEEDFKYIAYIVSKKGLANPSGKIQLYLGNEKEFEVKTITAKEYLAAYNLT